MNNEPRSISELFRLNEALRQTNAEDEATREQREAEARVRSWDTKMQRAFKGIVPRPVRHANLAIALERHENAR